MILIKHFQKNTLGEALLQKLGFKAEQYDAKSFNVLQGLGFTSEQIAIASEVVCGRMTVEGSPNLKPEHLAVFDCASKCGAKGTRYIDSMGHVQMMAAAQPFLSGAISKTVNIPHEATEEEVARIYTKAWELGLKAIAIYRDGSKLSQVLSGSGSEKAKSSKAAAQSAPALTPEASQTPTASTARKRLPKKTWWIYSGSKSCRP